MIKIKSRDNLYLDGMDPIDDHFHQRKIDLLKISWAGVFREHILPQLPVKEIAKHFDKYMGRPTKELTALCGACVLQQFFDLTDKETRDQLAFNQQWHYALDVFDEEDQIISLKTLWTCRQLLLNDKLAKKIFDSVQAVFPFENGPIEMVPMGMGYKNRHIFVFDLRGKNDTR